ncbi:LysM domain-containing protein [Sphingopyxis sp.]|uniref:LysM peptidoglycan-binding domain-containing protein n=1 Tax=Sphingopyxis sp. TaxID=1908224 RepID=UPI0025EDCE1B|nr:LysM domain-containing protein [Sphingopyxis sp.]
MTIAAQNCMRRYLRRTLFLAAALALTGCASGPKPGAVSAPASSAQSIETIAEHLNQGDVAAARKLIKSGLKYDPNNPSLALLRDSIARDPVELLGPQSFDYVVQPGDTLVGIAQRYLGNRLLTYQLARYNGIEKPTTLTAGQTLRIPGTKSAPARRAATPAPSAPATPSAPRAQPPKQAVAPPAARTDPAAARQLRTQGLAALNKGSATRAVQLLRRASALDPANMVIKADLARAERIAATVRSRR